MVRHIPVVSNLMMVLGALTACMGPMAWILLWPYIRPDPQAVRAPTLLTSNTVVYVGIGLIFLLPGILNVVAGFRTHALRGRGFAIVALFSNILPMFPAVCAAPVFFGIMIYGLIVFFNRDVVRAFEMVAAGESPDRVKARFAGEAHEKPEDKPMPVTSDKETREESV